MSKKGTRSPKRDSSTTAQGKPKVEWQGYVNFTLTEAHKNGFEKWVASNPPIDRMIDELTEDGYDLKVRYDGYNKCQSAQLFCTVPENSNAGWCLSIRASSWYKAIVRLLYVHYIALEEQWSAQVEPGWNDDNW